MLIFAADIVMAVAFHVLLKVVSPGLALLGTLWRTAQASIMIGGWLLIKGVRLPRVAPMVAR